MSTVLIAILCGVLGLCVGSFLNVVIHRVPRKESVVRPRSHCPSCGTELANRDNIPLLSWMRLGGRCRECGERISVRYPLVELGTAALWIAAAVRFDGDWVLPAFLVFFASLLAISAVDLEHYIIPNRIVYPTIFVSIPLLAAAAAAQDQWGHFAHALLGGAVAFLVLLAVHLVSPRGMGFGDVRLSFVLGLFLGWLNPWAGHVFLGLFLGFLLGSLIGLALIALRRRGRKDHIPFGPFLAGGAVLAVLFGKPVVDWYLGR
ncbi:MAG: prepilin signal peptidase PulO-like peptidase [Acidimicrobiales bacterium]|nr:prepilin signal peptidase PulO-like peptidase [Acidimicrobiales bacterium]